MVLLMHPTIMASGLIIMPYVTAIYAKQDMWISPILASVIGFVNMYVAYRLNQMFPNQTLVEYSKHLIGVWPGKIVGLLFLLFYLHINSVVIREYGELLKANFYKQTPMPVILGSMVFVCSLAVRGGLEVIARCAILVELYLFVLLVLVILLLIPDFRLQNLSPVMPHGLQPVLKGAVVSTIFYSEFTLLTFLFPYLNRQASKLKWGLYSVLLVIPTFVMFNLVPPLLFGSITDIFVFPVIQAMRYINIADFFEHLETIVMVIYLGGIFVKITTFFYAIVLGSAQWLDLSDYRPLVFPIGVLLVLFSIWCVPNLSELFHFFATTFAFYALSVQTVIPILLLLVARMRKKTISS